MKEPPHINKKVHKKIMGNLRKITLEEFFQTLIKAGICNPDGTLTSEYREKGKEDKMDKTICKTCRYIGLDNVEGYMVPVCRINPPLQVKPRWPLIYPDTDWCGHYSPEENREEDEIS